MFLKDALAQIPGIESAGKPDIQISGISYDSRQVKKGHLFIAIRGGKTDGARFVLFRTRASSWLKFPVFSTAIRRPD
jgi:UDP-N-acetylmuramyl pentapeptide synthase